MSEQRYPVGIDLGTTFSSISYIDDKGSVQTVRLTNGQFSMASAVYFASEGEIIVGTEALRYALIDASRVARAFKRHMGDPDWTFSVGTKQFRAEALSAMVIKKLIEEAAAEIGPVERVVISVPFMFDEVRRRATQHAGELAGVEVLDIVDEPVAGALAYAHTLFKSGGFFGPELDKLFSDGRILVYDLGGGTFDLTLMQLERDYRFEVLATDGDHALGGEDWDKTLSEHFQRQYRELFRVEPRTNAELMQELRVQANQVKELLSERPRVEVELMWGEEAKIVLVARGDFERMTEHLVERTRGTLKSMLDRKEMRYSHIDFILLIGGSSRMPMIGKMLECEVGRPVDMSLPPDTAVSNGAALFAAYRTGNASMKNASIQTVNPHALGLLAYSRKRKQWVNDVLIRANELTQTEVKKSYPVKQGANGIELIVLQGELEDPDDCVKLGKAKIPNLSRELLHEATVDVHFSFQQNNLLQVRGVVRPSGGQDPVTVDFEITADGSMSEDELTEAEIILTGIIIE